jgi:aspartate-semialdehyde dehydrogenase
MPEPKMRIPVAVLGATGSVGQQFVQLLDGHPWFQVVALTGSERTTGGVYGEVCHWLLPEPMPEWTRSLPVLPSEPDKVNVHLAFSALPADKARLIEPLFTQAGCWVCSNASAFRREPDVPILLPEVNPDHLALVEEQRRKRGWGGAIICNPNCTSTGLTVSLKPLQTAFGLRRVFVVSLQALSGAGYPGVASLDIIDNVIPYIGGEEEKMEWEPRKMLGTIQTGSSIDLAGFDISAQANRVAVSSGHMVCLSVELVNPAGMEEVASAFSSYQAPPDARELPSAPHPAIVLRSEVDRPQPRLDRHTGDGMTTVVGRLRADPLFTLKYIVLSHNTIRGAAGGAIYNAELLVNKGYL